MSADRVITDAGVIESLRIGITDIREAEGPCHFVEEIFLFETEPRTGIVQDGGAAVARCGVLPSGIMTSHMTRTPFLRVVSG